MIIEITMFLLYTTLAIMAELINLKTKVFAVTLEKAFLILILNIMLNIMLAILIRLLKIKIPASKQHTLFFLAFLITFRMLIYLAR